MQLATFSEDLTWVLNFYLGQVGVFLAHYAAWSPVIVAARELLEIVVKKTESKMDDKLLARLHLALKLADKLLNYVPHIRIPVAQPILLTIHVSKNLLERAKKRLSKNETP
jgi:hypothetical protein